MKYYIVRNDDGKWARGPLIPWKGTGWFWHFDIFLCLKHAIEILVTFVLVNFKEMNCGGG